MSAAKPPLISIKTHILYALNTNTNTKSTQPSQHALSPFIFIIIICVSVLCAHAQLSDVYKIFFFSISSLYLHWGRPPRAFPSRITIIITISVWVYLFCVSGNATHTHTSATCNGKPHQQKDAEKVINELTLTQAHYI